METLVTELSLRERKKRATRATLRRSAVELVRSRGLHAVTVEAIAAHADVSPRTFFNYFPSKEDVLSGIDPELADDVIASLAKRPADETPAVALRVAFIDALSPLDNDQGDLLERLRTIRSYPQLLAHHVACWAELELTLIDPLERRFCGESTPDWYGELVVATTLVAVRLAMMSWCVNQGRGSLTQELVKHLDVLADGLKQPIGEQR